MPGKNHSSEEPTSRRRRADDTEKVETTAKPTRGWGALANKKKEQEEYKEKLENTPREFWLKSGETAIVQFLSDEPFVMDVHSVWIDGKWSTIPCQLLTQKHCLMCRDNAKKSWKAAFKVLDYRGNWDKDKKKFKEDEKIEKYWLVGSAVAEILDALRNRRKKELTEMVFEVTKTGSGKTTSYSISVAEDEDGVKLKPVSFKEKYAEIEELVLESLVPTDSYLDKSGFDVSEN